VRRISLYGSEPNVPLIDFLREAGARVTTVAPYVYADAADEAVVRAMLETMANGGVDAIAFTSAAQVDRLFAVGPEALVRRALDCTLVAAVGPVVKDALERRSVEVRLMPQDSYFMKPLTTALENALGSKQA
jgi:uroporphyrinogen-III synthase